ncbi:MAG: lysine--tRNA ligase [Actinobacteria bacterium]|nr:lysine--tRNA ligase [Actinomycetota bacterium]
MSKRIGSAREQRARRLAKVEALRAQGVNPYPYRFDRDQTLAELRAGYERLKAGEEADERVSICGRVFLIRRHGGLIFLDLHDAGGHVQLYAARDVLGDGGFGAIADLDIGDWVGAEGTPIVTRTGELSVKVDRVELLSKAIRPLPSKGRGLTDPETRLRQRYVDLIVNPDTRRVFEIRHAALAAIREFLAGRGYVEVETLVLHEIAGGATARPFTTHHNALDLELYLRIALELHLKRLVVGGYDRVFEIGRVYRNEGVDTRHNPEFTMLEAYQAFADYTDMMELTEELVAHAARTALGTTTIDVGDQTLDFEPPWRRATMSELIAEHAGVQVSAGMPVEEAHGAASQAGVETEPGWGSGRIMNELYDELVEAKLSGPVFVIDHPREVSPLAKPHRSDPALVERFEVVVDGRELANAYSELNDPVEQRARFEDEARAKAAGDPEAGDVDEDYLRAMEYGLPPTGGLGIGIDRLIMLLTGKSAIREVILFPTLRPEEGMAARSEEPAAEEVEPPPRAAAPVLLPRASHERSPASLLAFFTALAGALSLLALVPGIHSGLGLAGQSLLPVTGEVISSLASVAIGFSLLLVAHGLYHRKRTAWAVAVVLLSASTVVHILKGPHPIAAVLSAAMLAGLIWARREFNARPDPPTLLAAFWFVPSYLALIAAYGGIALFAARARVDPGLSVGGVLETTFGGLIGLDGSYTYRGRFLNEFFPDSLIVLGALGLAALAWLVFRPIAQRKTVSREERAHAEQLVRDYGWDTLSYFALRDDKSLFFSSDGQAMIAYAYLHGHALVSADPVGAPGSVDLVLAEFLAFCAERGWRVALLGAREEDGPKYEALGLRTLYMGDEAIIRCESFSLQGPPMKKVREAVNRVGRGHEFRLLRESEASPELVGALNAISERWRGKQPERGFTMSLSQDVEGRSADILLAIATPSAGGPPAGFLRLVPVSGGSPGYSLDVMRHDPGAQNGLTEFLIAQTAETLRERGPVRLSLNFAAWGRLFHAEGDRTLRLRLARWIVHRLNPFFQIQSLYEFNAKFEPEWLPRILVYEKGAHLPTVALLYAGVEGFLALPVIGSMLVPRVVAEPAAAE